MNKKNAIIRLQVTLGDDGTPERIQWQSNDNPNKKKPSDAKAMLLSVFDTHTRETMKIDLWTKDMQVMEMDRFFYQTLRSLADTYFQSTQNKELAADMHRFVQYFGEKIEIFPKGTAEGSEGIESN